MKKGRTKLITKKVNEYVEKVKSILSYERIENRIEAEWKVI